MVDDHIKRKILLLGDGSRGQDSLIRRFVVDKFSEMSTHNHRDQGHEKGPADRVAW